MSFLDLDNYQQQNPNLPSKLSDLLPKLDSYLERELSQRKTAESKDEKDIVPVTLAQKFEINEGIALALLMVYENAGVVMPDYHVLCPDSDDFLATFKSPKELPETIHCPFHAPEQEHDKTEYHVDLVFHFTPQAMKNYTKKNKR